MIRLSCWIGVMGCVIGGKALAGDMDQGVVPFARISPVKPQAIGDENQGGGPKAVELVNAAPRLIGFFDRTGHGWRDPRRTQ
jgi:hypothetical protein